MRRRFLYLAGAVLLPGAMSFPAGDYLLRVTLRDNLSGKDLELTADVTLVE